MAFQTYKMKVRLTLLEEVLGSQPSDGEVYDTYIASKAPQKELTDEELKIFNEAVANGDIIEENKMTVFPRDENGNPFMYDYQLKGFCKDACSMLSRASGVDPNTGKKIPANESSKLKAFKKTIDGCIFPMPRKIVFGGFDKDTEMGTCQRPLRISGPTGERVALAKSETIPAGATLEFEFVTMSPDVFPVIREWLDYGMFRGLLQWRNSGKGRFTWEEITD